MTKYKNYVMVSLLGLAIALVGCGDDVGTPSTVEVNKGEAAQVQAGAGGKKATMGGGLIDEPMAAPAGVQTGMPPPGAKAGGG